ncbi:hypothetical protein BU23DRAFT_501860 [Bimuria novae-zelandiae CBS 107.79]|uniref:S-adenosyl-L-methionine-dependent methyltransferase n=1 Tax=Bimuria novae-zelandiae CBS 107.79 TaxID=1447943 RepID=A0A6A5VGM6_9PLEO|nr:hypothetical protein BU23DRAFT_501860 [Bimuria novae-zelandiae CBS 107.79]
MALKNFDPDALLKDWADEKYSPLHNGKTFEECIRAAFNIPRNDTYVYRAQGETTLAITQRAIGGKRSHGLHNWYHDEKGDPNDPPNPTAPEITAYTTLFHPTTSLPKALNHFASNSPPSTLRHHISTYLSSRFHPPTPSLGLLPAAKRSRTHVNPYFDLWTYACHELEWAGPWLSSVHTKISHHILPIFYHHFGCVVPSYAALHVIAPLAQPAKPSKQPVLPILDIGSGNGYWSFMLRRLPLPDGMRPLDVRPIDNGLSEYRASWVKDTITMDGVEYLEKEGGGRGCVLLLVYPQATGGFTQGVLEAFEGDTIVVAGTQNGNGFTAFQDRVVDEWVGAELPQFELVLRMPLPSFAGKDEALFVWRRKS